MNVHITSKTKNITQHVETLSATVCSIPLLVAKPTTRIDIIPHPIPSLKSLSENIVFTQSPLHLALLFMISIILWTSPVHTHFFFS
ncbi:MAG: hypothetical protein ACTSPB_20260, partial [Candidatus Thorarchaeota archaeon]